jgi:hypothetical protein
VNSVLPALQLIDELNRLGFRTTHIETVDQEGCDRVTAHQIHEPLVQNKIPTASSCISKDLSHPLKYTFVASFVFARRSCRLTPPAILG